MVVGAALTKRLRAVWSIAIRLLLKFRVAGVGVRAIMRIVRYEDFRTGIFPIDRLARRNVLQERRSMKI